MQRQVAAAGLRLESAEAHRAGVGKLNRVFRGKFENPDVGHGGIQDEVRASAARVHGKLVEVLERNVRREIDRTVNSPQRQQVKPGERQCTARWSGGNSIHTN